MAPTQNYTHDIANILSAIDKKTRIIFLVNPNNPTGTYLTERELTDFLAVIPPNMVIVLDEAYYEYMDCPDYPKNSLQLLEKYSNLIITRTFSKIYGLAGLRIGYAVSHPDIAEKLNQVRLPFNINSIATAAAKAALLDQEHVKQSLLLNQQGLKQLQQAFTALNIEMISSVGNFITINLKKEADVIYKQLLQENISVRPLSPYGLTTHLRVSVGTQEQNVRLIHAIEELDCLTNRSRIHRMQILT
ncbi:MAG: aminotransferase class I/II-fold pyridoxal phosphate-dependent enzyme [Gammaproteobacteria bacterium]|nr:MAG: aminotransferase class I/II-fold pyridoxal phosphate-dependent enzyme [Gammaproteobacteria bacterium]